MHGQYEPGSLSSPRPAAALNGGKTIRIVEDGCPPRWTGRCYPRVNKSFGLEDRSWLLRAVLHGAAGVRQQPQAAATAVSNVCVVRRLQSPVRLLSNAFWVFCWRLSGLRNQPRLYWTGVGVVESNQPFVAKKLQYCTMRNIKHKTSTTTLFLRHTRTVRRISTCRHLHK